MARIRTIKPEFFRSKKIDRLTYEERLTFIGLWTHVDDAGRCEYDPELIKADIWPRSRTVLEVEHDLCVLSELSLIVHYILSEHSYLQVTGWDEHQRINRPTPSKLPAMDDGLIAPLTCRHESSVNAHGVLVEDSPQERKGRERKGKDSAPNGAGAVAPTDITAQTVTAAWVDAVQQGTGTAPSKSQIGQVARTAKELLERNDPQRVLDAARAAGASGFTSIDRQLTMSAGRKRPADGPTLSPFVEQ